MPVERRHPGHPMIEGKNHVNGGGFVAKTVHTYDLYLHVGKNAEIFDYVNLEDIEATRKPAKVEGEAVVYGKAKLSGFIEISGSAKIYGKATIGPGESESKLTKVYGNAEVYQNAKVDECAEVYDNAKIYNEAHIYGHAKVFGDAKVSDNAKVFGNAEISGNTNVYHNVEISDNVRIYGDATICGELKVSGNIEINGGLYFSPDLVKVKDKIKLDEYKCDDQNDLQRKMHEANYDLQWDINKMNIVLS